MDIINLRKDKVINLKKNSGLEKQTSSVVLVLDYSGSIEHLYRKGTIQRLVERILPLGLAFDDNGEVDTYIFENGCNKINENITLKNIDGYVNKNIYNKYSFGGTSYAPIINKIVKDFGRTTKGFFSSAKPEMLDQPVYVIFITDGENDDRIKAEIAIREASEHGIFFQFVGVGDAEFKFLDKLDNLSGRKIDNANFFKVKNFDNQTDDDLYSQLLNEYPSFVKEARDKKMIK